MASPAPDTAATPGVRPEQELLAELYRLLRPHGAQLVAPTIVTIVRKHLDAKHAAEAALESAGGIESADGVKLNLRETQVLRGMSRGLSNGMIGKEHHLTEDTIKTYARHLFHKLGARDRAHAVAIGYETGLLGDR